MALAAMPFLSGCIDEQFTSVSPNRANFSHLLWRLSQDL